jgi:hypothetical protein
MEMSQRNSLFNYLKQTKCHLFLLQNQITGGQNSFSLWNWYQWEEGEGKKRIQEGEYGASTVYTCMQIEK